MFDTNHLTTLSYCVHVFINCSSIQDLVIKIIKPQNLGKLKKLAKNFEKTVKNSLTQPAPYNIISNVDVQIHAIFACFCKTKLNNIF